MPFNVVLDNHQNCVRFVVGYSLECSHCGTNCIPVALFYKVWFGEFEFVVKNV